MALLSGLVGASGRFSVPFSVWLLAGLGPFGLSGFCGMLVPGFWRLEWLPVAAGGCLGGFGSASLRSGGLRGSRWRLVVAWGYSGLLLCARWGGGAV